MSKCKRCDGRKTIQESMNGVIVVRPCPQCNELHIAQENGIDIFEAIRLWEKHTSPFKDG